MDAWLVIWRGMHFAAALGLFGIFAFERLVVAPCAKRVGGGVGGAWRGIARRLCIAGFLLAIVSGFGWFVCSAAEMTGTTPLKLFSGGNGELVWDRTHFGLVWKVRLALCAAAGVTSVAAMGVGSAARAWLGRAAAMLTAAFLASLAWAGHAGASGAMTPRVGVDVAHLLMAGVWPAGLVPLAWLVLRLRRDSAAAAGRAAVFVVMRYSNLSLPGALLLLVSGTAQIWFLTNPAMVMFTTYGRLLGVKIILYCLLAGLGGANRFYLVPRMVEGNREDGRVLLTPLLRTLAVEIALVGGIIAVVGVLGITAPGGDI